MCFLVEDKSIFNYWLSGARQIIENAFGILASQWRIFCRAIIAAPERVVMYRKAALTLHDYLKTTETSIYIPPGFDDDNR